MTHEPAPAGTLNSEGRSVELGFEIVETAKVLVDGILKRPIVQNTASALSLACRGPKVLPEKGMINVACQTEVNVRKGSGPSHIVPWNTYHHH